MTVAALTQAHADWNCVTARAGELPSCPGQVMPDHGDQVSGNWTAVDRSCGPRGRRRPREPRPPYSGGCYVRSPISLERMARRKGKENLFASRSLRRFVFVRPDFVRLFFRAADVRAPVAVACVGVSPVRRGVTAVRRHVGVAHGRVSAVRIDSHAVRRRVGVAHRRVTAVRGLVTVAHGAGGVVRRGVAVTLCRGTVVRRHGAVVRCRGRLHIAEVQQYFAT